MNRYLLPLSIVPMMLAWFAVASCTTAETGFIAGDLCTMEGVTVCDADGMVILECVSDGTGLFWQPEQDCLNGCTEESGVAECIGETPLDQDMGDTDKPSLPEDDPAVADDTALPETEGPAGDDATIETDNETVTQDDDAMIETDDEAVTQDDDTMVEIDDEVVILDDSAPIDEDVAVSDDAMTTDDDATIVDEDTVISDEDGLISDVDTAPVTCTAITLPAVLDNDGNNTFFASYTPNTGNVSLDDQFQFVIYDSNYQIGTVYTLGVGVNANIKTVDYFVFIGEDWNGSAFGKRYLAQSGTLTLQESGGGCGGGGETYVVFENVVLREILVDANGDSTFVPNGSCLELPAYHEMTLTPAS